VEQKMKQRPTGKVDVDECKRVGKLVQKWLTHQGHFMNFQRASLPTLRDLLGERVVRKLLGDQIRGPIPDLASSLRQLLENADEELQIRPALLFESKHDLLRKWMVAELAEFSTPGHHETLAALQASVDRFSIVGIDAALALEPFIRHLPTNVDAEEFDVAWLCAVARFANNLRQLLDVRLLTHARREQYRRCCPVFDFVFALLDRCRGLPGLGGQQTATITYELMLHHALTVQIAGSSPFNLSHISRENPLSNEWLFQQRLREATFLAGQLTGLPQISYVSLEVRKRLLASLRSALYRGLIYSKNPKLRPTWAQVESASESLGASFELASRSSIKLRYHAAEGEYKQAQKLCDDVRSSLSRANQDAMPSLLDPVFTVNSYRLGGSASSQEHKCALEQLREERIAYSLYGHHLISTGKDAPFIVG
jgi:hypothetical protein